MKRHIFLIIGISLTIACLTNHLYADAKKISLGANVIASVGRLYYGAELNLINIGIGYYYSPAVTNGTVGKYLPLYLISKSDKIDLSLGFDLISVFTKQSNIKSAPRIAAYEFYVNIHPLSFLSIGTRYFWSGGGYLPKGLSFSVGLQTPNFNL